MTSSLKVFVVEDEMTIALMIEDMLMELGHCIAGIAMRLPQAAQMAQQVDADLAILDINLDGRRSFPVAQTLRGRGVKVLFASGYGSAGLEPPFLDETVIRKPFAVNDLRAAIERLMS
jgi:DNA-binding response OmpR family regulator